MAMLRRPYYSQTRCSLACYIVIFPCDIAIFPCDIAILFDKLVEQLGKVCKGRFTGTSGLFVWRMWSHTHAWAHTQTYLRMSTHTNLSNLLSHASKVIFSWKRSCSIGYFSFNPSFFLWAPSLNNAVYVNSVSQALVTTARMQPKTEGQFYRTFLSRFSAHCPSLYWILF